MERKDSGARVIARKGRRHWRWLPINPCRLRAATFSQGEEGEGRAPRPIPLYVGAFTTWYSMRRFFSRPSAVSLFAIGLASP